MEQKLPLKHQFASFLLKQVPVLGSTLGGGYSSAIKISEKAKADALKIYLGDSHKFINDFCIRVIRHYGEEIANPNESLDYCVKFTKAVNNDSVVKELKDEIRNLDKSLGTKLILAENNQMKFIHDQKDYTEFWNNLIPKYIHSFMEFLLTKEAQDNFINKDNFGAITAKHLLEFHKVSIEELENITTNFYNSNV